MAKTTKYSGTQTEKNLEAAFAGESQARNKYTYFASVAKKQGFEQIADLFLKTADNEKEHAKMWFKELEMLKNTSANLDITKAASSSSVSQGQVFSYTITLTNQGTTTALVSSITDDLPQNFNIVSVQLKVGTANTTTLVHQITQFQAITNSQCLHQQGQQ